MLKVVLWKLCWAFASSFLNCKRTFASKTRPESLIGLIGGSPKLALLIKWSDGGDKGRLAGGAGPLSVQNEAKFPPDWMEILSYILSFCEQ